MASTNSDKTRKPHKPVGLFGQIRAGNQKTPPAAPALKPEQSLPAAAPQTDLIEPSAPPLGSPLGSGLGYADPPPESPAPPVVAAPVVTHPAAGAARDEAHAPPTAAERERRPAEAAKTIPPSPGLETGPAEVITVEDRTVPCKFCRRTTEVCRSRLKHFFEWLIAPLIVPYRCLYCGYRGFAFRFQVPKSPANQAILRDLDPNLSTSPPVSPNRPRKAMPQK